jgi:hypothetical protein
LAAAVEVPFAAGEGVAAGDAEVVGWEGAAVLVGAVVVQPDAASSANAATSASGDFKFNFVTSILIYF